jgi:ATP-dependent Clp protease ATP-binding subunit ClpA
MKLSVVVPAYNEELRIAKTLTDIDSFLKTQAFDYEIVVVVNGTSDHTYDVVKQLESSTVQKAKAVNYKEGGKGRSVKRGILENASGDIIMFMDADNATPISEISKFIPFFDQGYDVVIGSRELDPDLTKVKQSLKRQVLGKLSHLLIRFVLLPGIYDTQLGFKAFKREAAMDASNIIKPYLARGQLQLIGTTTTAEYRKYFEKDKAFQRRFQSVIVDEPNEETAMKMLEVLKDKYEKFHEVILTPDAIKFSVTLSKKYVGERYLPDKAIDLLDEAAAEVKLKKAEGQRQDSNVSRADIEKVVSDWTGIPITRLTEDEGKKLLQLEELIHKRLIDQEEAVSAVSEAVRRGRIGLASANRPIASFIFLGPTGVGKTELAKTLAEILFGKDDAMIRLDMSEYMEKHEVAKLIGAPPGYVGYEEGGQLTEAVRAKPYSIVLLDEVEKAHPDVFNILLQLLEDGRLTDNKGNTISFKNTIVIATSNIGSGLIQEALVNAKAATAQPQPTQPGVPTASTATFHIT